MKKSGRPTSPRKDLVFAQRIISARANAGLTQDELARALRTSRRSVCYWEQGRLAGISVARIAKIARVLNVDPRTLAYGETPNG